MDYSKLNGIRNFARSIGLNRLLTLPASLRSARRMREYEKNKPTSATFQLDGYSIEMYAKSAYEWMRIQSFHEDKHIISALKRNLKPGGTFWDIGASIGLYSNFLAKVVGPTGTVISFEPEMRSRERLNENIKLNGNQQIKVCPVALGKEASTLQMVLAEDASAGNHRLVKEATASSHIQEVQVYSADEYQSKNNLPIPQVVKIDVEGFEEDVIIGARNLLSHPDCKSIVIEVHFSILALKGDDQAAQRIVSTLREYGFTETDWLDSSHLVATK